MIPYLSFAVPLFVALATRSPPRLSPDAAWTAIGVLGLLVLAAAALLRRARGRLALGAATSAALHLALVEAETAIASLTESQVRLVGDLAHELKAPLASTVAQAEHLVRVCGDAETVRSATMMAGDLHHLTAMIDSFLKLSRPRERQDSSHHVPVAFHDLVLEVLRRSRALATERGIQVLPMLSEVGGAAVEVLGDPALLEAMIEKLVRNALLSAPRGSHVDLQVRVEGDHLVLSVHDRGTKLDEAAVAAALVGYFEVPEPARPAGARLSLAIAKRVAEHHRGTMSFRNLPDGGCEFEVQLPIWRATGDAGGAALRALPRD